MVSGVVGMLQRGKADIAYANLFVLLPHYTFMDYSDW